MSNEEIQVSEGRSANRRPSHAKEFHPPAYVFPSTATQDLSVPRNLHLSPGRALRVAAESRILVAVTGASGVAYTRRLIEVLGDQADVILTKDASSVIEIETNASVKEFVAAAHTVYRDEDMAAAPASGSHPFRALVVVPCSGTTLAKIASGIADNLVTRAAAVALKEHRPLILVPRETPVSAIALENELKLARLGVVILPASPGFYGRPRRIEDLVDFVVARILDQLGVEHGIGVRWTGPPE